MMMRGGQVDSRQCHKLEKVGSIPAPATKSSPYPPFLVVGLGWGVTNLTPGQNKRRQ